MSILVANKVYRYFWSLVFFKNVGEQIKQFQLHQDTAKRKGFIRCLSRTMAEKYLHIFTNLCLF